MAFGSLLTGILAAGLVSIVPLGASAGTALWTRRLARRPAVPRWALTTAWALVAATGLAILWGVLAFVHGFISAIADATLAPQDRQRLLAAGIAEAFYREVFALGLASVTAVWLGVATLLWRRQARAHA